MKKKVIILGTSTFGEIASFYLENDSVYEVVAFCSTDPQIETFCTKPVVDFAEVEKNFPPSECKMFVAVGCRKMNDLRKKFCEEARLKGYKLLSYISSKATFWDKNNKIGDNVFIFEDNTIQPFVEIGGGTILWSGNHIGHHTKIGNFCFISSHCVISGFCEIGDQSFLGVNSTYVDGIKIGEKSLVGAGALVAKDLPDESVILSAKSTVIQSKSNRFFN